MYGGGRGEVIVGGSGVGVVGGGVWWRCENQKSDLGMISGGGVVEVRKSEKLYFYAHSALNLKSLLYVTCSSTLFICQ